MRALIFVSLLIAATSATAQQTLLAKVPKAWPNVVYVGDLLPPVEALLASPRTRTICAAADAELGGEELSGEAAGIWTRLRDTFAAALPLVHGETPEEFVLAWSPRTTASAGALFEFVTVIGLGWYLREELGVEEPTLTGFRGTALEALARLSSPELLLAARMRDERVAERWFEQAAAVIEKIVPEATLSTEIDELAVRINLDALATRGSVFERIVERGVFAADSAELLALRQRLAQVELDLRFRREGRELSLQLGELPAPLRDAELPLFGEPDDAAGTLIALVWDATALLDATSRWFDLLYGLGEDSIGALFEAEPERAARLYSNAVAWSEVPAESSIRLALRGSSLTFDREQRLDAWTPPPLASTALARVLPPDLPIVTRSSYWTLDEWAYVHYVDVAERLGGAAVWSANAGRLELSTLCMNASDVLDQQLVGLLEFLGGEESAIFGDGVLAVADGRGGVAHGAAVGLTRVEGEGRALFARCVGEVARGFGLETPEGGFVDDFEIMPGIVAKVARLPGLPRLDAEDAARHQIPHAVEIDHLFIVSTSVALTRALIAANDRAAAEAPDRTLVTISEASGAGVASFLRSIADSASIAEHGAATAGPLRALAVVAEALQDARWHERSLDGRLRTRVVLRLRE